MKTFIIVALTVLAVASAEYSNKYDNVDFGEILSNCRLFVSYVECLLGNTKKCTKEGLELKAHITDALKTKCAECTDKQKEVSKHVIGVLVNIQKPAWEKVKAKYDPDNTYVTAYKDELDKASAAGDFSQYTECDLATGRPIES